MYNKEITVKTDKTLRYQYFIDPKHPLATGNSGRVYMHRHVASIALGRWLKTEEAVHHIDENKCNNSPDNLLVCSYKEHGKIHKPTECILDIVCTQCSKIFTPKQKNIKFCSTICANAHSVIHKELTKEFIQKLIWDKPYSVGCKEVNLSDTGLRKTAKRLGCILPPDRYHVRSTKDKISIRSIYGL